MPSRHGALLALSALALLASGPAFAKVLTLADDAGSGEDAPEAGDPAFLVAPDAWRWANLTAPFDTGDVYALDLAAGDTLDLAVRPVNDMMYVSLASADGTVLAFDVLHPYTQRLSVLIPESGTHYLTFAPMKRGDFSSDQEDVPGLSPWFVQYHFRVSW